MKNSSLLFLLVSTCIPTRKKKKLSRGTFIQEATSHFANGNDSMLIGEQISFMPQM